MAPHLATAARDRSRVLLATGHPAGLLVVHQDLARSLAAAGATVIMGGDGFAWQSTTRWGKVDRHVRYVGGVAVASDMGNLNHTHSAQPMRGVLAALAEAGEPPPDLVVADHGWAGAAGQAGITTVGFAWQSTTRWGKVDRHVRYVGGVAVASDMGNLNHTHSAQPMRGVLAALAEAGEPPPDLVVADHGWAGAAGQAGITTVGFADSNDPALFVGEAEGKIAVAVPVDDNVPPHLYAPMTGYLLHAAGLPGG
jgi:hypothetical protein